MSKYNHNFSMTPQDTIAYIREKLPQFFGGEKLTCREIGDGNINYVFRVATEDGGKSLIVKHAETTSRSSGKETSTDRNRIEAEILQIERHLAPKHVPEIYLYDPVMCCVVMEDIGDHENLRDALLAHKTFPTLAEDMAGFMAQTLIRTSDLILPADVKKAYTKQFLNPAMCEITERLVLTDPYKNPQGRNRIFPGNEAFVQETLYGDEALHLEIARLKNSFQSKAQCLIHGDLHSGSVFVKPGSTKVLDPEFAFYGPAGYDVGNIIAHFVFAWAHAEFTVADRQQRQVFQEWMAQTIDKTLALFAEEAGRIIRENCADPVFATPRFAGWYVSDILRDTAGYAGTEIIRRVVGSAKFNYVESITRPETRIPMERACIRAAKKFILGRESGFQRGSDYIAALKDAVKETN